MSNNVSFVLALSSNDRWISLVNDECVKYFNDFERECEKYGDPHSIMVTSVDELVNHIISSPEFAEIIFSQYVGMFGNTVSIHDKDVKKWAEFMKLQSDVFRNRRESLPHQSTSKFFITHMNSTNIYIHVW